MKPILVITATEPTAPNFGTLMRLRVTIAALARVADVELAIMRNRLPHDEGVGGLPVVRAQRFPPPERRNLTPWDRIRWLVQPQLPLSLVALDYSTQRAELAAWLSEYSLIWVVRSTVYHSVQGVLPKGIPVVVDIDDLESEKMLGLLKASLQGASVPKETPPHWSLTHLSSHVKARLNVRAWKHLDVATARKVDAALVCSADDACILRSPKVEIIPNSYPDPAQRLGRIAANSPPTILLQGALRYLPNVDGAEWFVSAVLPAIRVAHPDVRIRLIGTPNERVNSLAGIPNVEIGGFVPRIEDELSNADLVVAPIRFGGGTRIKILEAFAHQIPVVSTTVGAHGLDAIHDTHILIADSADGFAKACVRILGDTPLRSRLVTNSRMLYEKKYREDAIKNSISDMVHRLLAKRAV